MITPIRGRKYSNKIPLYKLPLIGLEMITPIRGRKLYKNHIAIVIFRLQIRNDNPDKGTEI